MKLYLETLASKGKYRFWKIICLLWG